MSFCCEKELPHDISDEALLAELNSAFGLNVKTVAELAGHELPLDQVRKDLQPTTIPATIDELMATGVAVDKFMGTVVPNPHFNLEAALEAELEAAFEQELASSLQIYNTHGSITADSEEMCVDTKLPQESALQHKMCTDDVEQKVQEELHRLLNGDAQLLEGVNERNVQPWAEVKADDLELQRKIRAEELELQRKQKADDERLLEDLKQKEIQRLADEKRKADELELQRKQKADEDRLLEELKQKEIQRLADEKRKADELELQRNQKVEEERLLEDM